MSRVVYTREPDVSGPQKDGDFETPKTDIGSIGNMTAVVRRISSGILWSVMLGALCAAILLEITAGGSIGFNDGAGIFLPLIGLTFGTVGLLLAWRVPDNRMAWVFLSGGTLVSLYVVAYIYFFWGVVRDWPLVWVAGWANTGLYMPAVLTLIAIPLLLFPTGRLPSPRWRPIGIAVVLFAFLSFVSATVAPRFEDELGSRSAADINPQYIATVDGQPGVLVDNPIGIDALRDLNTPLAAGLFLVLLMTSFLGPATAMVVRFHRSEGQERQQIKWVAFSATVAAIGLGSFYILQEVAPSTPVLGLLVTVGLIGVLGIPIASGFAIARYKLFEIDRLISRTISYAIIVGLLGAIYAAGAIWLPTRLLGEQPPAFVAASTLAIAVLFNPLRTRVQKFVDKRFNRSLYQTDLVVAEFADQLRDSLTVEELADVWAETVNTHFESKMSHIWLRDDTKEPT